MLVRELNIAPSEVLKLDFVEVIHLLDRNLKSDMDLSLMLNFERIKNGASKEWLQKDS